MQSVPLSSFASRLGVLLLLGLTGAAPAFAQDEGDDAPQPATDGGNKPMPQPPAGAGKQGPDRIRPLGGMPFPGMNGQGGPGMNGQGGPGMNGQGGPGMNGQGGPGTDT